MKTLAHDLEIEFILKSRLKELLQRRSITAAELSRRSGVPKQVLSIWLTGVEPRKLSHLKRVAQVLGVTIDELCFQQKVPEERNHSLQGEWIQGIFEGRLLRRIDPSGE